MTERGCQKKNIGKNNIKAFRHTSEGL